MNQIRELIHAAVNTFLHNPNQFASGVALGWVQWHPSFRKYAFESLPSIVYDACCLLALAEFVEEKTKEHKS